MSTTDLASIATNTIWTAPKNGLCSSGSHKLWAGLGLAHVHFTFKQQRPKQIRQSHVPNQCYQWLLTPAGIYDFQLKNAGICDKLQQMHHLLVTTKQQEDAEKK